MGGQRDFLVFTEMHNKIIEKNVIWYIQQVFWLQSSCNLLSKWFTYFHYECCSISLLMSNLKLKSQSERRIENHLADCLCRVQFPCWIITSLYHTMLLALVWLRGIPASNFCLSANSSVVTCNILCAGIFPHSLYTLIYLSFPFTCFSLVQYLRWANFLSSWKRHWTWGHHYRLLQPFISPSVSRRAKLIMLLPHLRHPQSDVTHCNSREWQSAAVVLFSGFLKKSHGNHTVSPALCPQVSCSLLYWGFVSALFSRFLWQILINKTSII